MILPLTKNEGWSHDKNGEEKFERREKKEKIMKISY